MTDSLALDARLTIDGAAFEVLRLSSREPVDAVAELACDLTDHAGGPDPATLVGKPLTVTVAREGGDQERLFSGIVTFASLGTGRGDAETATHVVARPRLHRLALRADCRVFQDMTAQEIVKDVLSRAGIPAGDQKWQLGGAYPKRLYTTQYRETDLDFVLRLLAEEGISFVTDSASGTDVVVFFDGDLGPIEGSKDIVYRPADGLTPARDCVAIEAHRIGTAPGRVNMRDHDFEKPRVGLDAKVEAGAAAEKALEVYVSPARTTDAATADRYARITLEAGRARREEIRGISTTPRLQPGHTFALAEHPYSPLNREYRLISVEVDFESVRHGARGQGRLSTGDPGQSPARIAFTAIPADVPLRPPRLPRAKAAPGAHVAVVTGPAGKEIHPDKHGRVKVQFAWDRLGAGDDKSSLWVRTSQAPLGGSMLTPRVGWETHVAFGEGDPDQPLVMGRVYNAKTPPPYPLPANKTRMSIQTATTPGGGSVNEIRMEDKAGSEELFMNASRDTSVSAGNNATEAVGNNESRSIGSNHALAVTDSMAASIGANQTLSVGGEQTVHVGTYFIDDVGSHSLTIGGNRDLKAGGDHNRSIKGASTLTIGGMAVDLVAGSADEMAMATMDDTIGGAKVDLTASNRTLTVQGDRTENAGAVKLVLTAGGRAVQVGGSLTHRVAGAILNSIEGTRADAAKGAFTEIAGGAQIIKATNVVFEAKDLLSVVMGASTITLTPASVSIAGTKITLDGEVTEESALVADN